MVNKYRHGIIQEFNELTVFVSNSTIPLPGIYACWLDGSSMEEARKHLPQRGMSNSDKAMNTAIRNQYRLFEHMETYLHRPHFFDEQMLFNLSSEVKNYMINMYYSFDNAVLRELLGKKLNSRSRKDLEEISTRTQKCFTSVRRQFENVKRIYRRIENMGGSSFKNVRSEFLLPDDTSKLDTSKKKLSQFSFDDFDHCASIILDHFTITNPNSIEEFDPRIANDFREIKSFLGNKQINEELKNFTTAEFSVAVQSRGQNSANSASDDQTANRRTSGLSYSSQAGLSNITNFFNTLTINSQNVTPGSLVSGGLLSFKDFGSIYRSVLRALLLIGSNMNNPKEIRVLIYHIVEKIVEPCVSCGWREMEFQLLFSVLVTAFEKLGQDPEHNQLRKALTGSFSELDRVEFVSRVKESWKRLCLGIGKICERLTTSSMAGRNSQSSFLG